MLNTQTQEYYLMSVEKVKTKNIKNEWGRNQIQITKEINLND